MGTTLDRVLKNRRLWTLIGAVVVIMAATLIPSFGGAQKILAAVEIQTKTFTCTVDLFGGGSEDCHGENKSNWDTCKIDAFVGDQVTYTCSRSREVANSQPVIEVDPTVKAALDLGGHTTNWRGYWEESDNGIALVWYDGGVTKAEFYKTDENGRVNKVGYIDGSGPHGLTWGIPKPKL